MNDICIDLDDLNPKNTATPKTDWPETVDILKAADICQYSLIDNGRACLLGHAALTFLNIPKTDYLSDDDNIHYEVTSPIKIKTWKGTFSNLETFLRKTLEDQIPHKLSSDSILAILDNDKKIGRHVIAALHQAINEITKSTQTIMSFNDWIKRPPNNKHLANIARVWNRAMTILGYEAGENKPLSPEPCN